MELEQLQQSRNELREKWRTVREYKLARKSKLLQLGTSKQDVRRDKVYKDFRKEQHHLSRMLDQLDRVINKKKSR